MWLKNGHIIIPSALAEAPLNNERHVAYVYYPERKQLLVTAKSKGFLEKLHSASWNTLKDKNAGGDKALFVREIMIEHDLDDTDRELSYTVKKTGIITIEL